MTVRFESQSEPIAGYRLIERLGSGGFGEVWKAEAPGGIYKAIKIIFGDLRSQDRDLVRFAEQELKALKRVKQVRHPYLLALDRYDVVDGRLLITMELADCNLWDRFREYRKQGHPGIPRAELLQYMSEAAEVLDLMNDRFQLQHLDIKPQNLFLLYNHVKVADFGQVKDLEGMAAQVTGGITPVYAAPETFDGIISRYCDQYSLACVYQELLTGQRPFDGTTMQQLLMQHLQMPPNLSPSPISDRPALARALSKRPEDRFPSCTAFVQALREGTDTALRVGLPAAPPSALLDAVNRAQAPADSANRSERIDVHPDLSGSYPRQDEQPLAGSRTVDPTQSGIPSANSLSRPPTESSTLPSRSEESALVAAAAPVISRGDAEFTGSATAAAGSDLVSGEELSESESFPAVEAPPEERGPGSLFPTLIVGAGFSGLRVLQRFRKALGDRFGLPERTPAIRTLYIDTDPEAVQQATADPLPGLARLRPEEVFAARLNRAQHYLKPRLTGRSLIEGWFDPQLLYKLPRQPATMGIRLFGRLAFCDHYRPLIQKIQAELEACLHPDALLTTLANTGLALRSNRPRVYLVAGLGGGTGGAMIFDLAYSIRARLKRLGYSDPEIIGIFLIPPEGETHAQTLANTYAALTELNHFSWPETVFSAMYDDRPGLVRDASPPFRRVHLVPGYPGGLNASPAPGSGSGVTGMSHTSRGSISHSGTIRQSAANTSRTSGAWSVTRSSSSVPAPGSRNPLELLPADRDPASVPAELLRLELTTEIGRLLDESVPPPGSSPQPGLVRSLGLIRFAWPRGEVISRTAQLLAHALVHHWVTPNADDGRTRIPDWVQRHWETLGLDSTKLQQEFQQLLDQSLGGRIEEWIPPLIEPLIPKGWLGRLPEPERVSVVVDQIRRLIGRPGSGPHIIPTETERALAAAAERRAELALADTQQLFLDLVEQAEFRPAGAEEALRQFLGLLETYRLREKARVEELDQSSGRSYDLLVGYIHYQRGMRKPAIAEFTEAIRQYPEAQLQCILSRALSHVYQRLLDVLSGLLNDLTTCRHRVQGLLPLLSQNSSTSSYLPNQRDLLPVGCSSVAEAARRFLDVLNDDDLLALDRAVQGSLIQQSGGLYQACLNSSDGLAGLLRLIQEDTRVYLNERLGVVDLTGMFWQRFGTSDEVGRTLLRAFEEAEPSLIGPGPWRRDEIAIFASPGVQMDAPIRETAAAVLPATVLTAESPDEVVILRDYPTIPLAAMPQLGPTWAAAYRATFERQQATAHCRTDINRWIDVDSV